MLNEMNVGTFVIDKIIRDFLIKLKKYGSSHLEM
jgi:hypothetical protein